jgi:tRNA threonylcarbamoyladenosine biosynthesis protein TsaE
MTHSTHSLDEVQSLATQFATSLTPRKNVATIVALSGDLGAGKTSFVQALARTYGVIDHVTSPTFVIEKIYQLPPDQPFKKLIHIDAYRLNTARELEALGWPELVANPEHVICIEWPERVAECIPADAITVSCRGIDETTHEYTF